MEMLLSMETVGARGWPEQSSRVNTERVGVGGDTPIPPPPLPVPSSLVPADTITTQRRRSRRFRFRDGIYRSDTFQNKQRRRVSLFGGSFHA